MRAARGDVGQILESDVAQSIPCLAAVKKRDNKYGNHINRRTPSLSLAAVKKRDNKYGNHISEETGAQGHASVLMLM